MSTVRTDEPTASKGTDVARLYEEGFTALEIALTLGISPQGVYWHLKRLELPAPGQRPAS